MVGSSNTGNNPPKPRRRWFRFGLRTMFVVLTVFSLWLGWQTKIVRDREEAIARLPDRSSRAITADHFELGPYDKPPRIPIWRHWLGDRPLALIVATPDYSDSDMHRLCQLFPEAVHIQRYNFKTKRWDVFNRPDANAIAMQGLWFLLWPAIGFVAIFAWLLVRMIRDSRATRSTAGGGQ